MNVIEHFIVIGNANYSHGMYYARTATYDALGLSRLDFFEWNFRKGVYMNDLTRFTLHQYLYDPSICGGAKMKEENIDNICLIALYFLKHAERFVL